MNDTYKKRIEKVLDDLLPSPEKSPEKLHTAMRYCVLGGGKRLRPALTYATGQCFGADLAQLDAPAAAVELIHSYSLVHDDLPAMDNDDLRRGKATCHKAFDEATAILVGDALQNLAFDILSNPNLKLTNQLGMLQLLAHSTGSQGMIAGQMLDLLNEQKSISSDELATMHALKTGALIRASILLGAMTANVDNSTLMLLHSFADTLGVAFQIKDDILDAEGDSQTLGKTAGLDQINQKANSVQMLGLENSKKLAQQLIDEAQDCLQQLPNNTQELEKITLTVFERVN